MIKVTKEQFQEWIKAQPDDRPVDMDKFSTQRVGDGNCGCVMWEYAKDHNFPEFTNAVIETWENIAKEHGHPERVVAQFEESDCEGVRRCVELGNIIWRGCANSSETFGELKNSLL